MVYIVVWLKIAFSHFFFYLKNCILLRVYLQNAPLKRRMSLVGPSFLLLIQKKRRSEKHI